MTKKNRCYITGTGGASLKNLGVEISNIKGPKIL